MKFDVYVTVRGVGFNVTGCYERYVPARTSGHPDEWEPSEPEEYDVESVTIGGTEVSNVLDEDVLDYVHQYALHELRANA